MELTDELAFEDILDDPPYVVLLSMDGEAIWESNLKSCEHLAVSVDSDGEVTITENTQC
ncbi:hypothetical protein SAMN04487948_103327 [Halogranum amylolyticum]|uniref:Uncharacterized protein n=1 Tax=Halogranum amylolyticum TaxID=660520 RepID=A0A1H8QUP7_9EURY|nr:hypothetical protein [Halogranum amylolyticum]SEO58010.1 hypothetical protein SAMN04487948_103327 [Halogranum amylolyticum]